MEHKYDKRDRKSLPKRRDAAYQYYKTTINNFAILIIMNNLNMSCEIVILRAELGIT